MSDFFEAMFKFFSEFTWRKLLAVVLGIAFAIIGILAYERYTSSFRLSRLQKATDLLVRLQDLQAHGTNSIPDLERARRVLTAQVVRAIEEEPISLDFIPSKLKFSVESFWKFIAGSALWCVFALFQLPKARTKEGKDSALGLLMLGGTSGFFALFVPAIWWPWFHLLIYPWLLIAVVLSILVPFAALGAAKRRAQKINCINSLKQVILAAKVWALDHNDVLPKDFASMRSELKDDRVALCPADKNVKLEILSPGALESEPEVVYARCPVHNTVVLVDGSVQDLKERELFQQEGKWRVRVKAPPKETATRVPA